jgi:uncharacterized protein GlcG (DUF336 family)
VKGSHVVLVLVALLGLKVAPAGAQLRDLKGLTLDGAKNIVAAAEAEARKNNWNMAFAVVDAAGDLVLFHKTDAARPSNGEFALGKARTAARFQRPTKSLDSTIAAGRIQFLAAQGALPIEGGVPIIVDGKVIGAVGVSGGTSAQDAQVATAGIGALVK